MKFSITQGITILAAGFVFLAFVLVDKQAKVSPVPDVLPHVGVQESEDAGIVDTSDWVEYRNEEVGVQFSYPSGWGPIKVGSKSSSGSQEMPIGTRGFSFGGFSGAVALYVADNADAYFYCGNFGANPCDFVEPPGDDFDAETFCTLTSASRGYLSELSDSRCDTSSLFWRAESVHVSGNPEDNSSELFIVRAIPPATISDRIVAMHMTVDAHAASLTLANPESAQLNQDLERILSTFEFID